MPRVFFIDLPERRYVSGFQTKVFNSEDKNIFKFDDTKNAELIEIKTAQNLETHVLNNADIHIQKDQAIEIKGDAVYQIENGSLTETARKIVYKVGSSTLTLKGSGAFLNAAKINLNCGNGAAEAKTEGLGAVGSGAGAVGSAARKNSSSSDEQGDAQNNPNNVEKMYPSIDVKFNLADVELPILDSPYYILESHLSMGGLFNLKNNQSMNPAEFQSNKNSLVLHAKKEVADSFGSLQLLDFNPVENKAVIGNSAIGQFSSTSFELINANQCKIIFSNENINFQKNDWKVKGVFSAEILTTIIPKTPGGKLKSDLESVKEHLMLVLAMDSFTIDTMFPSQQALARKLFTLHQEDIRLPDSAGQSMAAKIFSILLIIGSALVTA